MHTLPWACMQPSIHMLIYIMCMLQENGPSLSWEKAKKTFDKHVNCGKSDFHLELVYGCAGNKLLVWIVTCTLHYHVYTWYMCIYDALWYVSNEVHFITNVWIIPTMKYNDAVFGTLLCDEFGTCTRIYLPVIRVTVYLLTYAWFEPSYDQAQSKAWVTAKEGQKEMNVFPTKHGQ